MRPIIAVTYSPCLEIAWRHKEMTVGNNERVTLSKEDGGFYHCDINQALLEDEVINNCKSEYTNMKTCFRVNGVLLQKILDIK